MWLCGIFNRANVTLMSLRVDTWYVLCALAPSQIPCIFKDMHTYLPVNFVHYFLIGFSLYKWAMYCLTHYPSQQVYRKAQY